MDGYVTRRCCSVLNSGHLQEQMFLSSNEAPTIINFTKASAVAGRILLPSLAYTEWVGGRQEVLWHSRALAVFVHVVSHSGDVR